MWDDANAYDVATGWYEDDLPYWESLVDSYRPARVLELACGTGRVTLPLSKAGFRHDPTFRLVGLDSSVAFLDRAREKLRVAPSNLSTVVSFVQGDMREFDLGEDFDLVILPYNSLTFLHDIDDQLSCFASVRQHLTPGGRFAIDMSVPDFGLLHEAQHYFPLLRQELSRHHPAPGIRYFASSYVSEYDLATQKESTTHHWQFYGEDGRLETSAKHLTWHMYFPRELELLFGASGLKPEEKYGGYDLSPFSSSSRQYLWVMAAI